MPEFRMWRYVACGLQGCFMTGTYGWYIEGTDIKNVVYKIIQMRTAKHLALAMGKTVRGSNSDRELDFKFYKNVQTGSDAQHNVLFNGYRSSLPGVKGPGRKVNQSPSSRAKVTNQRS